MSSRCQTYVPNVLKIFSPHVHEPFHDFLLVLLSLFEELVGGPDREIFQCEFRESGSITAGPAGGL